MMTRSRILYARVFKIKDGVSPLVRDVSMEKLKKFIEEKGRFSEKERQALRVFLALDENLAGDANDLFLESAIIAIRLVENLLPFCKMFFDRVDWVAFTWLEIIAKPAERRVAFEEARRCALPSEK